MICKVADRGGNKMDKVAKRALMVAACAIAFGSGIFAGYEKNRPQHAEEGKKDSFLPVNVAAESAPYIPPSERETETAVFEHYLVKIEDNFVTVSEVYSDNGRKILESAEIERGYLRREDRELLEKGIVITSRDEALMMIEDFIS